MVKTYASSLFSEIPYILYNYNSNTQTDSKAGVVNILPNPRSCGIKQNMVQNEHLELVLGHFNGQVG